MKLNDAILGAFFLALALWVGGTALTMPRMSGTVIGAGTFPLIVAAVMAAGGAGLLLSGLRRLSGEPVAGLQPWLTGRAALMRSGSAILFVAIYALFGKSIGFPLLVPVMMVAMLWLTTGRPFMSLILGCAVSAAVWLLFARVLMVPLPTGILAPLFY